MKLFGRQIISREIISKIAINFIRAGQSIIRFTRDNRYFESWGRLDTSSDVAPASSQLARKSRATKVSRSRKWFATGELRHANRILSFLGKGSAGATSRPGGTKRGKCITVRFGATQWFSTKSISTSRASISIVVPPLRNFAMGILDETWGR